MWVCFQQLRYMWLCFVLSLCLQLGRDCKCKEQRTHLDCFQCILEDLTNLITWQQKFSSSTHIVTNATADSRKIWFKTSLFVLSHRECSRAVTRFQFRLLARAAKTPVQGKFPEEIKAIHTNIRSAIVSSSPLMSNHQTALKEQWVMLFPERRWSEGGWGRRRSPLLVKWPKWDPLFFPPFFSPLLFCFRFFFMALFYRTIDKWQEAGWDWGGTASSNGPSIRFERSRWMYLCWPATQI